MTKDKVILSLETSGRKGSVALSMADRLLEEKFFSGEMKHSSELFPTINELLNKHNFKANQITDICLSIGPGSFTGLRISLSAAKTISYANKANIVAVDTLDVIAQNAISLINANHLDINAFSVILDAKRGDFYVAVYELKKLGSNNWDKTLSDCVVKAEELCSKYISDKELWLLGEGLLYYTNKFQKQNIRIFPDQLWYPKASMVHKLGYERSLRGEFDDPVLLVPKYLRSPDVTIKK